MPITSAVEDRSAVRAITVKITNDTSRPLLLVRADAAGGSFGKEPPAEIKPHNGNDPAVFEVRNSIAGQGCSYTATYSIEGVPGVDDVVITGSNPWRGNAEYTERLSGAAYSQGLHLTGRDGYGQLAQRVLTINEAPTAK